jgi:hypothetical protein
MVNYYRINVAKNGVYLFATEAVGGGGGGITSKDKADEVIELFKEKFPVSEGFNVSCVYWQCSGEHINIDG